MMNVMVYSTRCAHCVHVEYSTMPDRLEGLTNRLVGMECPLSNCGVRVRQEDLVFAVPEGHWEGATSKALPPSSEMGTIPKEFSGFSSDGAAHGFPRGDFAREFRSKVEARARGEQQDFYRRASTALTALLGGQQAKAAVRRGDLDKAVWWIKRAVRAEREPQQRAALYLQLAVWCDERGDLHRMEFALHGAAADWDSLSMVLRNGYFGMVFKLARQLGERGELPRARELYGWVRKLDHPKYGPIATANLGTVEDSLGHHQRAAELWEIAYASDSRAARGLAAYNLGWHRERKGDIEGARHYYRLARKLSPRGEQARGAAKAKLRELRRR